MHVAMYSTIMHTPQLCKVVTTNIRTENYAVYTVGQLIFHGSPKNYFKHNNYFVARKVFEDEQVVSNETSYVADITISRITIFKASSKFLKFFIIKRQSQYDTYLCVLYVCTYGVVLCNIPVV